MNKFLKLTGVSVLAIVATTGANAAGYTCEELIEYTSCNPGYYLNNTVSLCPEGSTYGTGYCEYLSSDPDTNVSEESCVGDNGKYIAEVCYEFDEGGTINVVAEPNHATANTCSECPAGSYCPAGSESPIPCPAGSYCAGTKLGAVSGVCAIGSYSLAGATACSTCPASGLTDANGNVVSVTTASTGSTSSSACFVAKGTLFKDSKGTYKYTDNCEHGNYSLRLQCENAGGTWQGTYCNCGDDLEWIDEGFAGACIDAETRQEWDDCGSADGAWSWDDLTCDYDSI